MTDHPGLDRLPAHQTQAFMVSDTDADIACVPDCPACAVLFSLDRFYQEAESV